MKNKMMKKMEVKVKMAKRRYEMTYKKFIELVNDEEPRCIGMEPKRKGHWLAGYYMGMKQAQKERYAKIFNK